MILGMTFSVFVHVLISLVGIGSGFVFVFGLLTGMRLEGWTATFLTTTVATSVTGFLLPASHFMPSHAVVILSLIALSIAIAAHYVPSLATKWRATYVISSLAGFYFNFFVLVAQMFMKIPVLHSLAPTGSEPAFLVAQSVVLVSFILIGVGILYPRPTRTLAS